MEEWNSIMQAIWKFEDTCNHIFDQFCDLFNPLIEDENQGKGESRKMKVSYKSVTGELLKLEQSFDCQSTYMLEIIDEIDGHKHTFEGVHLEDIKFIGGAVSFVER